MKNSLFILLTILPLVFFSCSKDDDESFVSDYKGEWSGTYEGSDKGTWSVTIDANGNITGEAISDYSFTYTLSGTVNDGGDFNATTGSASNNTTFTGKLYETEGYGSWENSLGYSGLWQGERK